MTHRSAALKRAFDVAVALLGLTLCGGLIVLAIVLATLDTRRFGLFLQERVGRRGRVFRLAKIRTMREDPDRVSPITVAGDPRVTRLGALLRRTKLDELPQLVNVLIGDMSLVGPRPDVPGFADRLEGEDRVILTVRPGITGPATLKYRDEESLLARQPDPQRYNREVVFPDKVRINREYVRSYSFRRDLSILARTLWGR